MEIFQQAIAYIIFGFLLGYFFRQEIAKRKADSLELKLKEKILKAKDEAEKILLEAKEKATRTFEEKRAELEEREKRLFEAQNILLEREKLIEKKREEIEIKEKEILSQIERLKREEEELKKQKMKEMEILEKLSSLTKEEAKARLFQAIEKEYQQDFLDRIIKLKRMYQEQFEKRAKDILVTVIERQALSQAQEVTTTFVNLPSEEIKGRIIGKEGRNIRTFERVTGTTLILDESVETIIISSFNPVRRQIAKRALEKLIADGRFQPARIEEVVAETEKEIDKEMKEIGENVVYDLNLINIHPELIKLLGSLKFRTSYGQNCLLHSIEVALLAEALAHEIGADPIVAKKAGLFHDIGKAVEESEGSHVELGMKILEKYGVENEVISAMKSHHEEYPVERIEAVLVKVADQISASRPGARKETIENYLKRLEELEKIALSFEGVEKAWALQAGREIRVFVKPEEVDDLTTEKLARQIANKIEAELKFPGEIKVTVIREKRVVEYAK